MSSLKVNLHIVLITALFSSLSIVPMVRLDSHYGGQNLLGKDFYLHGTWRSSYCLFCFVAINFMCHRHTNIN